ncbi:hypothetical protein [Streptomyces roseicoloratus]|uniref:Uncharacterized protein n=1 Tax=Streptomyces roseicoloratus TaxID=2508722 RepID=A0ABY9RVL7_9ACTN|nr:hypothetical protein [Streptomyces roseicoloratus]WMX45541.1 hypothetical protein RGF97_12700 [Streptomyces roseicoloratus]
MVLIKNLPQDAAVQRRLHGEAAAWSLGDHLLAAVVDHLAVGNWMFQVVNSDEDSDQPDHPKPVPRPGAKDEEDDGSDEDSAAEGDSGEAVSPASLARFFG